MERKTIKVKEDFEGSESGHDLDKWEKGKEYTVTAAFADMVVKGGLAEYADTKKEKPKEELTKAEKKAAAKAEKKADKEPKENKSLGNAPENK